MSKKSHEIYKTLFQYIKENIFDLDPYIFITDYEQGLRTAVNMVFPQDAGKFIILTVVTSY